MSIKEQLNTPWSLCYLSALRALETCWGSEGRGGNDAQCTHTAVLAGSLETTGELPGAQGQEPEPDICIWSEGMMSLGVMFHRVRSPVPEGSGQFVPT